MQKTGPSSARASIVRYFAYGFFGSLLFYGAIRFIEYAIVSVLNMRGDGSPAIFLIFLIIPWMIPLYLFRLVFTFAPDDPSSIWFVLSNSFLWGLLTGTANMLLQGLRFIDKKWPNPPVHTNAGKESPPSSESATRRG
jgi:hypothetical protein